MSPDKNACAGCLRGVDLDRRAFVSSAAAAAAALLLVGCASDDDDSVAITLPPAGTQFNVTLASYPALSAVGGVARVVADPPLALARTSATQFTAYSLICPHQGTQVTINGNNTLRCPNHGAEFAFDGRWTGGAQRTASLTTLSTAYDATTGVVRITI